MEESDARLATVTPPAPVPKWLRAIGIGLGVLLVPPIVIPIVLLVMALGMLAFLPFLPPLLAEFMYSSQNMARDQAKERERMRHGGFRHHRARARV